MGNFGLMDEYAMQNLFAATQPCSDTNMEHTFLPSIATGRLGMGCNSPCIWSATSALTGANRFKNLQNYPGCLSKVVISAQRRWIMADFEERV